MIVYHVSRREVHGSIVRGGIDPAMSIGKLRCAWFVTERNLCWAVLHVMRRYGIPLEEVRIFQCDVPKPDLKKFRRGIYRAYRLVLPFQIRGLICPLQVANEYPGDQLPASKVY